MVITASWKHTKGF